MLHTIPAGISRAACLLALDLKAAAIVATSSSGNTARMVARFRPSAPIVALTDHIETLRQLSLSWGVIPHLVSSFFDTDQMFALARSWATQKEVVKPGDMPRSHGGRSGGSIGNDEFAQGYGNLA